MPLVESSLLLFVLLIFAVEFLFLWSIARTRAALIWSFSYLIWAISQTLQQISLNAYDQSIEIIVQILLLTMIFLQAHGLQVHVGEARRALHLRLAILVGAIGVTCLLITLPGATWAVLFVRISVRLVFTGLAIEAMRHQWHRADVKLLTATTAVIMLVIAMSTSLWFAANYTSSAALEHGHILRTNYVLATFVAIVFAIAATSALIYEANLRYRSDSLQDALSGLPNRRHFEAVRQAEWRHAASRQKPLSLLLIDIDVFKAYNDTYGHAAGDRCIVQVAQAIRSAVRRHGDLCARLGGEEFAVLLPGAFLPDATVVAEKICAAVRAAAIPHAGSPNGIVTVSVGAAALTPWTSEAAVLFEKADASLYRAKANGRNRVEAVSL